VSFAGVEEEVRREFKEEVKLEGDSSVEVDVEVLPPGGKEGKKSKLSWLRIRRRKR